MHRFYIDREKGDAILADAAGTGIIQISSGETLEHIKVRRILDDEPVEFIDFDEGRVYTARALNNLADGQVGGQKPEKSGRTPKKKDFEILEMRAAADEVHSITLFQGKTKAASIDFISQRAIEAGASEICFFDSDYSEKKQAFRMDRAQKKAMEAAIQCKAERKPIIYDAGRLREIDFSAFDKVLFFYESGGSIDLPNLPKKFLKIAVVIGSEGGFSEEEADWAREKFGELYSLGSRVLKAETASIAAISVVMHELLKSGRSS